MIRSDTGFRESIKKGLDAISIRNSKLKVFISIIAIISLCLVVAGCTVKPSTDEIVIGMQNVLPKLEDEFIGIVGMDFDYTTLTEQTMPCMKTNEKLRS